MLQRLLALRERGDDGMGQTDRSFAGLTRMLQALSPCGLQRFFEL
jgi:hypothetical protein